MKIIQDTREKQGWDFIFAEDLEIVRAGLKYGDYTTELLENQFRVERKASTGELYNNLATTKNNLNEWVTVKANVKEHFKKFHDLDVNDIEGVAIMTDTDNSKKTAIAYYQNIYFSSE